MTLRTTPSGYTYDLTITEAGPCTDEMRKALWEVAVELAQSGDSEWLHSLTPDAYMDEIIAQEEITNVK